jgi:hypothetical protein
MLPTSTKIITAISEQKANGIRSCAWQAKSKGRPCRLNLGLGMCLRGLSFLISKQLLFSLKRFAGIHSLVLPSVVVLFVIFLIFPQAPGGIASAYQPVRRCKVSAVGQGRHWIDKGWIICFVWETVLHVRLEFTVEWVALLHKMRRLIQMSDLRAAVLVTISVFSAHPWRISQDSVRVLG